MKFERQEDGTGPSWYAGIYKIVHYDRDSQNHGRVTYRAYYIRPDEKMWGWYVDRDRQFYTRLAEAQAACRAHKKGIRL